jgi:hypothetical protein
MKILSISGRYLLALMTLFAVPAFGAGQVTSPINAPSSITAGHVFAAGANPQLSVDGGVALHPGKSVNDPGTGAAEALLPVQTVSGTSKVFAGADIQLETRRSNSGTAMTDSFPASSAAGSAIDTIAAGAGTTINGGSTDTVYPGRSMRYVYDAPNTIWRRTLNSGSALVASGSFTNGHPIIWGPGNIATDGGAFATTAGNNTWSGTNNFTGPASFSTISGWTPVLGVSDSSIGTPPAAGSGFNNYDVVTLNDGCTTHGTLGVSQASSGGIVQYTIINRGSCSAAPPTNGATAPYSRVGVLAVSPAGGSGASFDLLYAPIAAGLNFGALTQNSGNLFLTPQGPAFFAGTETTAVGYHAGGNTAYGNFNWFGGHNAGGIGTACVVPVQHGNVTVTGTDALRNSCGASEMTVYGGSALKLYDGKNETGHAGFGITAIGGGAMFNWNGLDNATGTPIEGTGFPFNTAVGDGAGSGLPVSSGINVNYVGGTMLGANTGTKLTSASNFLIVAGGGGGGGNVGATTFASGSSVILVGSGGQNVDTPAAGTSNYINFENIWKVTGTNTPSTSVSTFAGSVNASSYNGLVMSGTPFGGGTGSNTFVGDDQNSANITSGGGTFIGDRAGGNTVNGGLTTAVGASALGINSACTGVTVNNSGDSVFGYNAIPAGCGITNTAIFGNGGLGSYTGNNNSTHAGFGTSGFGVNVMANWNGGDFPWNTAVGYAACQGATGATFVNGTCLGPNTGKTLTSAYNFMILSGGGNGVVGDTTFASGNGVILVGSGGQTVDTPAAGTSNYINFENIWKATGTNNPATSVSTIAGTFNVAGSGGYQVAGTAGVSCSGSPTASFASLLGIVTHC